MHSSFRPILFLALALGPCSVVAQQAVDADTPVEQAQVAETSPTAGAPSAEQAPPEMAEIEEAWRQGDFVLVREGLRHLAEEGGTALAQYRYGRVLLEGKGGPQEVAEGVVWLERAVAQNEPGAATLLARVLMTDGIDDVPRDMVRAAKLLEKAATRSDTEAQYYLGLLLQAGQGVERDPEAAFNWLLAAAEGGVSEAQFEVAKSLAKGEGTLQDEGQAMSWLERAASNGNTGAQYAYGLALDPAADGEGDLAAAMRWFRRAAEGGHPLAQRSLGTYYLTGAGGLEPDREEALRWLSSAAEAGDAGAMQNLAVGYLSGDVLPQDDAKAAEWFARAAQQGLPRAVAGLANLYEIGRGVPADEGQAISLYRAAAEAGDVSAVLRLSEMELSGALDGKIPPQVIVPWMQYAMVENVDGAEAWLQARADEGVRAAQTSLGLALVERDGQAEEGVALLTTAAKAGDVTAQTALGSAYSTGEWGLPMDYVAAYSWLNMAGAGGASSAVERRDLLAQLMTPEDIAEAQAATRALFAEQRASTPGTK